ncbi:MAG: proline--tRNA ligase, partial [Nanoarchaeota archaeon]|nr:proline--tRNA ligase [Nanoarchaeota archaeon]
KPMPYTEIKEKGNKKYYYRAKSVRKGEKVEKQRLYLGGNLKKQELQQKEQEADKKLNQKEQEKSITSNKKSEEVSSSVKKVDITDKKENKITFNIDKNKDFSNWYTDIVQKAELADLRSNVKGFLVFQPWSVLSMEKMYKYLEQVLQKKGHKPYWFPTLIPEKNFKIESSHVEGFNPEVFWVTEAGDTKLEERLALRPTSETIFYQMFSIWIRSYKDLPFKTYQRANVFRYETKATRPFLRSREFHWIEAHCAHATEEDAMKQVHEDMETTKEVLHDIFCLPFLFFERPFWDKFPGAQRTFAADVLNPDGKVVQQPSTHLLKQDFAKGFNVKFKDKDEKEKYCWITCYGPAVSRIFASIIAVHGDNKGLKFPWKIAPLQIIIIPIGKDNKIIEEANKIKKQLEENNISVEIDNSDKRLGEKFYFWEMKGVPLRIELGKRELDKNEIIIYRRDLDKKESIKINDLIEYIKKASIEIDQNLTKQADKLFDNNLIDVKTKEEIKEVIESGKIARCGFCSVEKDGEKCAEVVEKETGATVKGTRLDEKRDEKKADINKCVICGKKANHIVYVARQY